MAARDLDQDDLSRLAEDSLTDAGQMLAGGMAGPGESMTAEGSPPSAPLDGSDPAPRPPAGRQDFRRTITGGGERGRGEGAAMPYACPADGTWSVTFTDAEVWKGPDGEVRGLARRYQDG